VHKTIDAGSDCEGAMKRVNLGKLSFFAAMMNCAFAVSNLYATPVPAFNLQQLVKSSDLIVVGQVSDASIVGETVIAEQGPRARMASVHVHVTNVLMGNLNSNEIVVNYLIPEEPIGYGSLKTRATRLLFLKRTDSNYGLASRYFPSLPAVSGVSMPQDDPLGQVIAQEAAVLVSQNAETSDKHEALYALGACNDPRAVQGLAQDLAESSSIVRLEVISELAIRGNLDGIKLASQILLAPSDAIPGYILHNLSVGIRDGARDERTVPEVSALLQVKDNETREAAAEALRRIGSKSVIDPLARALSDEDKKVRYQAVAGLSEIMGDKEHHPNLIEYSADESSYLEYWRTWSGRR
jgi:hypothetical protein